VKDHRGLPFLRIACLVGGCLGAVGLPAAEPFVRARIVEPAGQPHRITTGGHRHDGPNQWYLPATTLDVAAGQWSDWIDTSAWKLHGRLERAGGVAEWPSMKLTVAGDAAAKGVRLQIQLAERPAADAVVIDVEEASDSNTVAFLLVHPLRDRKGEFETGSQMSARHLAWARAVSPAGRPDVGRFRILSSVWGHYDPRLAREATETLGLLGVNVMGGVPVSVLRDEGMRTYTATWHLSGDPEAGRKAWDDGERKRIVAALATPDGRWTYDHMAHFVVADEIQTIDLRRIEAARVDGWFREYLRERGETDASLGLPIATATWRGDLLYRPAPPRDADLATRRLAHHSGRFAQWWSVRQLRQTSDLIRETFAAATPPIQMPTETLPSDHAFFDAWGPPKVGMAPQNLDLFEIGRREAVDVVSAEDWMGLNHMYGPDYTWLGGQGFGYLSSILRSGIRDRRVALRGLITPSDDRSLRLKAFSNLGQGSKSLFYWTFGPTWIGTENYWSDLRSMYEGIAHTSRALARAEPILYPARTVSDPVAILYSVSHDHWHTDDPAVFVETRLLYAALRHLSIQPDFLGEEEVIAGLLDRYRVLYLPGNCLERKAAAAVDAWVRAGGVLYLSAGAATRDEAYEPVLPPFAATVYPATAAASLERQSGHRYNERRDLPAIPPLAQASLTIESAAVVHPAIGYRMRLAAGQAAAWGTFADGGVAAATVPHGEGRVVAVGFLPGLAYSPFKVGQKTLDEVWNPDLRKVFAEPLRVAGVEPLVEASVPVVEANLLTGPEGSAVVLANYTHRPIERLSLRLPRGAGHAIARAESAAGVTVAIRRDGDAVILDLPLDVADIVLLPTR